MLCCNGFGSVISIPAIYAGVLDYWTLIFHNFCAPSGKKLLWDSVKGVVLECARAISCAWLSVKDFFFLLEIIGFDGSSHSATVQWVWALFPICHWRSLRVIRVTILSHELPASEADNSVKICAIVHADKFYWGKMKLKRSFVWKLKS